MRILLPQSYTQQTDTQVDISKQKPSRSMIHQVEAVSHQSFVNHMKVRGGYFIFKYEWNRLTFLVAALKLKDSQNNYHMSPLLSYKRSLDSYACPDQSRREKTKLANIFTCKKYSKLVEFSGKRHSVSVHASKMLQKGPFLRPHQS